MGEVRVQLLDDCCSPGPDVSNALLGQQMFRLLWLASPDTLAATPVLGLQHRGMMGLVKVGPSSF